MKSGKRFISIILSMLFILSAIVGYSLFVVPAFNQAKAMREEIDAKTRLYDEQRQAVKQVRILLAQFEENVRIQETLDSILPVGNAMPDLLTAQISGLAALNGLALETLLTRLGAIERSSVDIPLAGGIGKITFEFAASGNYESFKNFLSALETNIRIMDVSSLEAEATAGQNLFKLKFTADAYYQTKAAQ